MTSILLALADWVIIYVLLWVCLISTVRSNKIDDTNKSDKLQAYKYIIVVKILFRKDYLYYLFDD